MCGRGKAFPFAETDEFKFHDQNPPEERKSDSIVFERLEPSSVSEEPKALDNFGAVLCEIGKLDDLVAEPLKTEPITLDAFLYTFEAAAKDRAEAIAVAVVEFTIFWDR